ncbi:hypothetical protein OT109_11640 [Phycisphaeraceae bacterium D3-23]
MGCPRKCQGQGFVGFGLGQVLRIERFARVGSVGEDGGGGGQVERPAVPSDQPDGGLGRGRGFDSQFQLVVAFVEVAKLLALDLHPVGEGVEQRELLLGPGLAGLCVGRGRGGVTVLEAVGGATAGRVVDVIPIRSTSA